MIQIYDVETEHNILYSPFDGPVDLDIRNLSEAGPWCQILKCHHY